MASALKALSYAAEEYTPFFLRHPDDTYKVKNSDHLTTKKFVKDELWTPTYYFKKFVLVTGVFSDIPPGWATTLRKAHEYVLPFLARIGHFASEYAKIGAPFSMAFIAVDLGEGWNDFNYFLNGGFYADLKSCQIFSAIAHILLVPVNVIGTAQFLKACDLANTLGGTRVFYYVEKVANLRWINSIPGLARGAAWLSHEGWINVAASFGAVADGCLLGAFLGLGLSGIQRAYMCGNKAQRYKTIYENALKQERRVEQIDDLRNHKIRDLADNPTKTHTAVELAKLKKKWIDNENAAAIGECDVLAAISEGMLKIALMAGVVSPPALAILGTFALVAVGRSVYYRVTTKESDMASLLR